MPPERHVSVSREEFDMFVRSQDQLSEMRSNMIRQGFDGINNRLDGLNAHLGKLNGKTDRHGEAIVTWVADRGAIIRDIKELKRVTMHSDITASTIENEIPSRLIRNKKVWMVAGGGGAIYAGFDLIKMLVEFLHRVLQ